MIPWQKHRALLQLGDTKSSIMNVSASSATVHTEFPVEFAKILYQPAKI